MKTLKSTLVMLTTLATFCPAVVAQEADRNQAKTNSQALPPAPVDPATPAPTNPPPPPPAVLPKPPAEQPQGPAQQKPVEDGQWVYTAQYGWVWMPYGDRYTHLPPDGSTPNMYVYYPEAGWCWVVAPWLWGWGPMPYFGVWGPRYYAWFGVGLGHWYGYGHAYWSYGWHGRGYWGAGHWNSVNHHYGGYSGYGRGLGAPHGGGSSRGLTPGWHH